MRVESDRDRAEDSSSAREETNPYPGPRPFQRGEKLYGREREITELFYLLSAERIVLLHSPSGAGKSSLVDAGLVPKLEEHFDVWPTVRLSLTPEEAESATDRGNRFVRSALSSLEEGLPAESRQPVEAIASQTLSEYIAGRPRRPDAPSSVFLLFDQFEEILTLDPFDLDARKTFFLELGQALRNPEVWALFAIREDYLGALAPYRDDVPTRLRMAFRIDLLTRDAAVEAITRPAHDAGREFDPGVADKLAEDLATVSVQQADGDVEKEPGIYVEPVQLQVVCRRLWDKLPEDAQTIGMEQLPVGDVDGALADYYSECVGEIARDDGPAERRIREWFGEELITAAGIRGQVIREKDTSGGLENDLVARLRDTHLVRAEQRAGATWYELAHDRLIAPVRDSNAVWFAAKLQPWQQQARLWKGQKEPESLLLRDRALRDAETWARENPASVDETERELLARSVEQRRTGQTRRRTRSLIGGSLILLIVAVVIGVLLVQAIQATHHARNVTDSLTSLTLAAASSGQPAGQLDISLLLSLEAERASDTSQARDSMISALDLARRTGAVAILRSGQSAVAPVAFRPDGTTLAAGAEGKVVLWDVANGFGKPVALDSGQGAVNGVAFSRDGRTLAAAGSEGKVVLWDVAHGYGRPPDLDSGQSAVLGVAFSPDGRTLAAAGAEGKVVLWDVANGFGKPVALDSGQGPVNGVAFSPDGNTLAAAGSKGKVVLWDVAHGYARLAVLGGGQGVVNGVAFSRDGSTLAAAGSEGKVVLWDVAHGDARLAVLGGGEGVVNGVAFSRDGRTLAAADSEGKVVLWDVAHGYAELPALDSSQSAVNGVAFSPDGRTLAAAGAEGKVVLWDAAHGYGKPAALDSGESRVNGVAFSPDGRTLAAAGFEGKVVLWDAAHGYGKLPPLDSGESRVWGVAFSRDGSTLAAAGNDGKVVLWDVAHGYAELPVLHSGQSAVNGVAFSRDGTLAAAGAEGKVVLWDAADGYGKSQVLDSGQGGVLGVAFSRDGRTLAAAGSEGKVVLWDAGHGYGRLPALDSGQSAVLGVAFSPGGRTLAAAGSDGKVRLWDLHGNGKLPVLDSGQSPVVGVAFSPDGSPLAAVGSGGEVVLWDAAHGYGKLSVLDSGQSYAYGVGFSSDGSTLAAAGVDGKVVLWDFFWQGSSDKKRFAALKAKVCGLVHGNLTVTEWETAAPGVPFPDKATCPD